AELVAPVFTVEGPHEVLVVRVDHAEELRLGRADLTFGDGLVEQISLRRNDVDQDLVTVTDVLIHLVHVPLVPLTSEPAGSLLRQRLGQLERLLDLRTDGRVLEVRRRLLEPLLLLLEQSHVLDVAEEIAIAESRLDDGLHRLVQIRLPFTDLDEELVELLVLVLPLVLLEDLLELLLDRLGLLLEPRHDDRRAVVVAVREVDDRLEDVRLGVERLGEVRSVQGVDVAESAGVLTRHEVGPGLFEVCVEPVLAVLLDLVPVLDRRAQLRLIDRRSVRLGIEPDGGGVERPRHRQLREVEHAVLVLDALRALGDRLLDALEGLDGGHRLPHSDVADAGEELRPDVLRALAIDLLEEPDRLLVVALLVLVAPQHVVELPVELPLLLVVGAREVLVAVLTDAGDDVRRLGEVGGELGQPEQGLVEPQVVRVVRDHAEDREARLE